MRGLFPAPRFCRTDGRTDGRMDEWTDGLTDGFRGVRKMGDSDKQPQYQSTIWRVAE